MHGSGGCAEGSGLSIGHDPIDPKAHVFRRWSVMGRWVSFFGRYKKEILRINS